MTALTPEQQAEITKLVAAQVEELNALSSKQRKEVEEIFDRRDQASSLSSAQKWDVASIVAKMAGGFGAVLGIAAYFAVINAARDAATNVKAEETAKSLMTQKDFVASVKGQNNLVVSGSVIAFDLATGCPAGWTEYANAAGRTIVGVGQKGVLSKRLFQEQGGKEQHNLSLSELPPHKFSFDVNTASASRVDRYNAGGQNYPVVTIDPRHIETNIVGEGASFPVMSPYVALFYCRKN